jgi:hypothetical protein
VHAAPATSLASGWLLLLLLLLLLLHVVVQEDTWAP